MSDVYSSFINFTSKINPAMNEIKHITTLFQDIYKGEPWIDITLMGTLDNIPQKRPQKE